MPYKHVEELPHPNFYTVSLGPVSRPDPARTVEAAAEALDLVESKRNARVLFVLRKERRKAATGTAGDEDRSFWEIPAIRAEFARLGDAIERLDPANERRITDRMGEGQAAIIAECRRRARAIETDPEG